MARWMESRSFKLVSAVHPFRGRIKCRTATRNLGCGPVPGEPRSSASRVCKSAHGLAALSLIALRMSYDVAIDDF